MKNSKKLVQKWFDLWEKGSFHSLPLTEEFKHVSPYGTIHGKKEYMDLIEANRDKFLGHQFEIHDSFFAERSACVRYTGVKENFKLEVSEWYYLKSGLIDKIIAYYNIEGEISDKRKLKDFRQ